MTETLEDSLVDTASWFKFHRGLMNSMVHQGFDACVDSLIAGSQRARELEILCLQAREFLDGTWCPDDIDRNKFLNRLKEITCADE